MLNRIIEYSIRNKTIIILFTFALIGIGLFSVANIPIGAVPDVTNNQVQVITTSRDLSTQEVERYLTYPVELEMANLPGVQELRSISKFGLSVVTIVFDDDMGTYLPRQLIAERLKNVEDMIPSGFGTPEMGPISTGLGEIYQYILDVEDGYEDRYSVTELRTIQDWIVKRQLSGIPGVVEVNTWGGFLKNYEVSVNPDRLHAMDLSLTEVYDALETNNSVAGGGYIEKTNESYFIRSEGLVRNIADIQNIVVTNRGKTPILIKDIAEVGIGAATRFGAITGNAEGEKILGQVMMLKGANSKEVIKNVKNRVAEIQSSLPEGVFINPFLERSELIGRTTMTIAENLILGFLIVLFVVVFLLGNIRSGLVVASMIPLTLLFAITMMYVFGVDANLMSLGAIDFGIIIDGAVIIVEFIAFRLTQSHSLFTGIKPSERQGVKDNIVVEGATKMMNSATFGQIIIVIVFIPVLALAGVEGKMFRPMALTFCFALIGAMILCFTYVPVMASLFLKPIPEDRRNISTRFIQKLKDIYKPILGLALRFRAIVLIAAVALFVFSGWLFSRMGGEFVPTLDEGDFVIQPVLKVGMSLAETVNMTTRIEEICLRFPEVKQVVSRIGAAEVPTDPMSMEESDVIITLKEKHTWTTAKSKDELADVIKDALLKEIPGIEIEFTQPIEMRFNELISGVSSDLAIKIFGEDLDILYQLANTIEQNINDINGIGDISIEKIDGLPQMSVIYDRAAIAKYGTSIDALNNIIATGFAGKSAGVIFEGQRQFDIVLRYDKANRSDLTSIMRSMVSLPSGQQLPLSEFAEIKYSSGPAMISRDDSKRRVVIGINVRNRDLQSVVDEVQQKVNSTVRIPAGYEVTYGGQFENLEQATERLLVAVPIALALIFILLYFAFHSITEALLIYTAIPLSAIGGVLALYLRDMPFSISAGIGFIALFGIAVLNGIVLIEHFKELKSKENQDMNTIIIQGAVDRLRPVLLTAIAAALGFLPMAISSSAGAEVQRPLATVVIGGLLSATLLTLVVLPIIYQIYIGYRSKSLGKTLGMLLILGFIPFIGNTQTNSLTLEEALSIAKEHNLKLQYSQQHVDQANAMIDGVAEYSKTNINYEYDRNNVAANNRALHVVGIAQSFRWPGVNAAKKEIQQSKIQVLQRQHRLTVYELEKQVKRTYDQLQYYHALQSKQIEIDSIYRVYQEAVDRKIELGEGIIIEKMSIQRTRNEFRLSSIQTESDLRAHYEELKYFLGVADDLEIVRQPYTIRKINISEAMDSSQLAYYQQLIELSEKELLSEEKEQLPDWSIGAFAGLNGFDDKVYPGVQAGIAVPLNKKHYNARIKGKQAALEMAKTRHDLARNEIDRRRAQLTALIRADEEQLTLYNRTIIPNNESLLQALNSSVTKNKINYLEYLLALEQHVRSKIEHQKLIHQYNQTTIELEYLDK